MRTATGLFTLCVSLASVFSPANAAVTATKHYPSPEAGKLVAYAMPAFAAGVTVWKNDWQGLAELATVTALTYGTAYGIKQAVRWRRPDGSGWDSFPSTTSAIASAPSQYMWRRYGWEWGLPLFVVSKYPSYALNQAKKNRLWDSVGSLAISFAYNQLVTTKYQSPNYFDTALDADSKGVYLSASLRW